MNIIVDIAGRSATIRNDQITCQVDLDRLTWSVTGAATLGPSAWPGVELDGQPLVPDGPAVAEASEVNLLRVAYSTGKARVTRFFQVWADQPFVRTWGIVENTGPTVQLVTGAELLRVEIVAPAPLYLFHVDQFSWRYRPDFFVEFQTPLTPGGAPLELRMGAFPAAYWDATSCGWMAVSDRAQNAALAQETGRGFVAGFEFNGKSRAVAIADGNVTRVTSTIDELRHALAPGETFAIPACFVGLYAGDWDEAGYVTQRFTEAHVSPPRPDDRYPWVEFNTWGYGQDINESLALAMLERAAQLGAEVFVLDLGWATQIGEWYADPVKFPRGLSPVAERAHAHGMKFGLHLPLAQVNLDSPVARAHPDWLAHAHPEYFGAAALCLGHRPCREWLIEQILRLVDEEHVDYLKQDGEDMVKRCERADHTHATGNSNYANSVQGLDEVITTVRRLRPQVVWENCENGGCMLTYQMARLYHTSITVDCIPTYATRQGVYGASYPFSPRYSVRYLQDAPTPYTLRSAMFGGPLILMQRLTDWTAEELAVTQNAVAQYKQLRELIRDAKVVHLLPPRTNLNGQGWGWDAIQAVAPDQTRSVVLVYRAQGDDERKTIRPRGLRPRTTYRVHLTDAGRSLELTGEAISTHGIELSLPEFSSELMTITQACL